MMSSFKIALVVWFGVIAAIRLFGLLSFVPFFYDNMSTIVAVLLVYPPVLVSLFLRQRVTSWQLNASIIQSSLLWLGIACLAIFPLVVLGNHFYQKVIFGNPYHMGESRIWMQYALTQFVLVAFPEEFFFRGYLQEEFQKFFPAQFKLFGVPFGKGIIYLSLLFAVSHSLITLQWWHVFIFFPSLVFSWLKERTGAIWASTGFHFACNMFAYWVVVHYA